MKKQIVRIRYKNRQGSGKEMFVHGYPSKVPGLAITLDYDDAKCNLKSYGITHIKSGIGFFLGRFSSIRKANNVLNKFLSDLDWTRGAKVIQADPEIIAAYKQANKYIAE